MNSRYESEKFLIGKEYNWQLLPWRRVYLRIFMLQKQIYYFTKRHQLNNVYNIQQYLINSNEAKVLAMKHTLDTVLTYYFNLTDKNYSIKRIQNYCMIQIFFPKYLFKNKTLQIIREIIKQNLTYLCLEPYQRAKVKQYVHKSICIFSNNNNMTVSNLVYDINLTKIYQNMPIDIIILRLQLPQYIAKLIISWLRSGYIVFNHKIFNLEISNHNYEKNSPYLFNYINKLIRKIDLADLISQALYLDVIWHRFISLVETHTALINQVYSLDNLIYVDSYKHRLVSSSINHKYINMSIKYFVCITQFNQYIKKNLTKHAKRIIHCINYLHCQYVNSKRNFIHFCITKDFNIYLNVLIYNSLRKQYLTHKDVSKLQVLNHKINLYTYKHNINNYYANFKSNLL